MVLVVRVRRALVTSILPIFTCSDLLTTSTPFYHICNRCGARTRSTPPVLRIGKVISEIDLKY